MPTKQRESYVQVREAATGTIDGEQFVLSPGEVFDADHEIVRSYPGFFKPLESSRQRPSVEQATAAPGEKRGERVARSRGKGEKRG